MTDTDSGLKGRTGPHPPKNKAKPGDTVLPFTCPNCKTEHLLWIDIQRIPELERDEIGQVIRDPTTGEPVQKTTISHSYISVPRLHPAWSPEMEEELKILYERSKAERDFANRNKQPKILAEVAA